PRETDQGVAAGMEAPPDRIGKSRLARPRGGSEPLEPVSRRTGVDVGTGSPTAIWRHLYFTVHDGTRLYARDYGPRTARALPVVCLAGLTRNSKDFHLLAERLSAKRRVLALDWRGRGRSGRADWRTYTPM